MISIELSNLRSFVSNSARASTPRCWPRWASARGSKTTRGTCPAASRGSRRRKQIAYNAARGITPRGVTKRIKDIIEGVYDHEEARRQLKAAQTEARYGSMDEKALTREVKRLEKEMLDAARNLEFERAAQLRDQLRALKQRLFIEAA
jgi:excinuclease ABC subunit B